jgi:hypothetical protein
MSDLQQLNKGYHKVGFQYKVIDGRHLIGMNGNLDTIHDGLIEVKRHDSDGREAIELATFITEALNTKLGVVS